MKSIRTGVAGVGHHGYHHARIYHALEESELAGVADIDEDRGRKVAQEFGVTYHRTVESLVDAGVDAVSVATPSSTHFDVGSALLRAGVNVLMEKPMAGSIDQAAELVQIAKEMGQILQVGYIERFNGAVLALFDSIKRPRFIECHRLSPFPNRGDDVSVVMDLMVHDLDIALALDGTPVESVDAIGVPVFSPYEDIANARIRFESGCVANVTCSRVSMDRMRKIRIFEEDAYVSTDYSEQEVLVYRKKAGKLEPGISPMELITVDPLDVSRDEPLKLELQSFIRCVRNADRPACSGEDGVRTLRLADRILKAIRNPK